MAGYGSSIRDAAGLGFRPLAVDLQVQASLRQPKGPFQQKLSVELEPVILQLRLLAAKGQGQQIFDRAGSLRDGLYVAKGPREAGAQLVKDAKIELARVEGLLRAQAQ